MHFTRELTGIKDTKNTFYQKYDSTCVEAFLPTLKFVRVNGVRL